MKASKKRSPTKLPRIHTALFEQLEEDGSNAGRKSSGGRERKQAVRSLVKSLAWPASRLEKFQNLVVGYRKDPTIENYFAVRSEFPELDINVSRYSGLDPLSALERLFNDQGIPVDLILDILDARTDALDKLSLKLLELLIERRKIPKTGLGIINRRRKAISDSTINYLIAVILEGCELQKKTWEFPSSLIVLILHQLKVQHPDLGRISETKEAQKRAALLIAQSVTHDGPLTIREVAKLGKIPVTTAARWLKDSRFRKSLETYRGGVFQAEFAKIRREL